MTLHCQTRRDVDLVPNDPADSLQIESNFEIFIQSKQAPPTRPASAFMHAAAIYTHTCTFFTTMSIVTVQLGQCGNQIGSQLFKTVYGDATGSLKARAKSGPSAAYHESSVERFFYIPEPQPTKALTRSSSLRARSVLVDMETKVVHQTLSEAKKGGSWSYDESCVYTQKKGSGNNWASGYCRHGGQASEELMEMVQRQAERCDRLDGFMILMSVAGGTGSGVGAKITEVLSDVYPHSVITNQIVWPYSSGEVIVQDYNTILTTAHLQKASDIVLLMQNDQLHKVCSKLLLLNHISFSDINQVMCHSLASLLQPAVKFEHLKRLAMSSDDARSYQRSIFDPLLYSKCSLNELQAHLCPRKDFKFVTLKSIPQIPDRSQAYSSFLWSGLLKHLRQMLITDSPIEEGMDWSRNLGVGDDHGTGGSSSTPPPSSVLYEQEFGYRSSVAEKITQIHHGINKSLANLLVLRGSELQSADVSPFYNSRLYSQSVPKSCTCSVWCSEQGFNGYEKTCTLVSNSQSCAHLLDGVCRKAWNMFSARAYLYQYTENGLRSST